MSGAAAAENAATSAEDAAATPAPVTQAKDEPRPPARNALVEEATRVAVTLNEKLPPLSAEPPAPGTDHKPAREQERESQAREEAAPAAQASRPSGREENGATPVAGSPAQDAGTGGRIGRRAAMMGASVGENLRPRVEKLREASTVVLDEATDDPGLRFVIVAAVLFLLFLFILLFSYILG